MGHHEGYMECASHVKVALKMKWDTSRCFVNAEVEKGFAQAQKGIILSFSLSLPIMDLVSDALQHDDFVERLQAIFQVVETQEQSDDEEENASDGGAE
ncbi:hypothetical protein HanOQP8_Chr01g0009311 [Helianthus annuus]|nr:hypothetical protein HanOQP8_Chr01g0009311 [Helianthus annuus]